MTGTDDVEGLLRRLAPQVLGALVRRYGHFDTARMVHRLLPADGEVTGLLALMLLTDARRPARTGPDGGLIPMAEQDRSRWDADAIAEGVALITGALPRGATGPYQLQ